MSRTKRVSRASKTWPLGGIISSNPQHEKKGDEPPLLLNLSCPTTQTYPNLLKKRIIKLDATLDPSTSKHGTLSIERRDILTSQITLPQQQQSYSSALAWRPSLV